MGKIEGISKTSSCLAIDTTPKKYGAVPKIAYRKKQNKGDDKISVAMRRITPKPL